MHQSSKHARVRVPRREREQQRVWIAVGLKCTRELRTSRPPTFLLVSRFAGEVVMKPLSTLAASSEQPADRKVIGRNKRRGTCKHLVQHHAHPPPVGGAVVPLAQDQLGRDVLGRAAECPRILVLAHHLCKAKIDQLQVAMFVEQQVLRLEVTVCDSPVVQVLERHSDRRTVESGRVLSEPAVLGDEHIQLTAQHEFCEQVECELILERLNKRDDEWVVTLCQDLALAAYARSLSPADNLGLLHLLERVSGLGGSAFCQLDDAVATSAQQ
eukprot:1235945-Prymnesium_polylepis.1